MRDSIPRKGRLLMANSFVIGIMIYLLPLWGSTTNNFIARGQSILNWAACFRDKVT